LIVIGKKGESEERRIGAKSPDLPPLEMNDVLLQNSPNLEAQHLLAGYCLLL
jgi:hypothetical protein